MPFWFKIVNLLLNTNYLDQFHYLHGAVFMISALSRTLSFKLYSTFLTVLTGILLTVAVQ